MAHQSTESKRLLSHTVAEWACFLNYKHLSPEGIEAAKLFWFDSIGCALGGSQQDDAKILLKHYRAMSATADSSAGKGGGKSRATAFVSGFKTNTVDATFLNGHMIRAMDYNDIYWKADTCHPSDLIAAPLALCESEGLRGQDLILATVSPAPSTSSMERKDCLPCSSMCNTRANRPLLTARRWLKTCRTRKSLIIAFSIVE